MQNKLLTWVESPYNSHAQFIKDHQRSKSTKFITNLGTGSLPNTCFIHTSLHQSVRNVYASILQCV